MRFSVSLAVFVFVTAAVAAQECAACPKQLVQPGQVIYELVIDVPDVNTTFCG
jgi:hypothetical protein